MSSHASLTLRKDITGLASLDTFVTGYCAQHGLAADTLNLIAEECFVNVVEHGETASQIDISLERQPGAAVLTIEDDGIAFDPLSAPPFDASASLARRAAGGLGIHLVRSLAADARYQRIDGKNRLTLRVSA